jgi:hypothetical protein
MKKNTTAALLVIVAAVGTFSTTTIIIQSAQAFIDPNSDLKSERPKAPAVISGENVYVVWWTDRGTPNANGEVMFRASNDGGATFGNKTNLSNTDTVDSINAEIAAEGDNVLVSWWETNQTSDISVARVSNDAGETFGPLIMLGTNGTISTTTTDTTVEAGAEEEEEAAAAADDEGGE